MWKVSKRVILRRFLARLKPLWRIREIFDWYYETCDLCGSDYRLAIHIKERIWIKVNGRSEGTLCMDCFIKTAQKKNVQLTLNDFVHVWVFDPKGKQIHLWRDANA